MAANAYDLVIIGAGSAGFAAAIAASEQGARVALIGSGVIGGTCTNIGCLPSKTLIRAVETVHHARAASRFAGIDGHARVTDWGATIRQKNALVTEQRQAKYTDLLPMYPRLTYLEGTARILDDGVAVGDKRILAPRVVTTTGARPTVPEIQGIDSVVGGRRQRRRSRRRADRLILWYGMGRPSTVWGAEHRYTTSKRAIMR